MDRVIVHHRHDWAKGTKVSGLAGRAYTVADTGQLLDSEGLGVHADDAAEFREFRVFVVATPKKAPPAPPPPPPAVDLQPDPDPALSDSAPEEEAEKPKSRKRK